MNNQQVISLNSSMLVLSSDKELHFELFHKMKQSGVKFVKIWTNCLFLRKPFGLFFGLFEPFFVVVGVLIPNFVIYWIVRHGLPDEIVHVFITLVVCVPTQFVHTAKLMNQTPTHPLPCTKSFHITPFGGRGKNG